MTRQRPTHRDALETAIESALEPGHFVGYGAGADFVSGLEEVAAKIGRLLESNPDRAVLLYETFLAGCYEKVEELDGSSGNFGMFVDDLYAGWIKARQAAGADPDETAKWLLARMDDDPYGFTHQLEGDAAKVMNKASLAAFARHVRARFDGEPSRGPEGESRDADHARRRWSKVLRAIYAAQRDVIAYVTLCEETELSAQDCLAVATLLRKRKPAEALDWVDRGLALDKKHPHGSMASHDLAKMRRELLTTLGRGSDALEEAWAEFREHPSKYTYEELIRFVPKARRAGWHAKAMEGAGSADLGSLVGLLLETKEIDRLVERLRQAKDAELEGLSHYTTQPAAKRLATRKGVAPAKGGGALLDLPSVDREARSSPAVQAGKDSAQPASM